VVLTREGVDKLEIYRRLGVREVWFWQNEQFAIHHLRDQQYEAVSNSVLLPDLHVALLAAYVIQPDPLDALLYCRHRLRQEFKVR
jgi:Putative restriction endonuclease